VYVSLGFPANLRFHNLGISVGPVEPYILRFHSHDQWARILFQVTFGGSLTDVFGKHSKRKVNSGSDRRRCVRPAGPRDNCEIHIGASILKNATNFRTKTAKTELLVSRLKLFALVWRLPLVFDLLESVSKNVRRICSLSSAGNW
jgi:hypothetical protein